MVLQVLDILTARHGKVVRETFREAAVKKWSQDTFSHGAFVMEGVEQRPLLQVSFNIIVRSTLIGREGRDRALIGPDLYRTEILS